MRLQNKSYLKYGIGLLIAVVISTIGAGFYREISAGSSETYKGLKLFSEVIELVEHNYVEEVDSEELIHKAIQGMIQSLDPHSQFLPPEALEELKVDTQGEFGGIGIVITMKQNLLTVISPIEGTPAYRAGIKAGDIITQIDGESTKDMMLWEAVKKMRGPKGEPVKLVIHRETAAKPLEFTLIRDIIPIESVKYALLKPGYGYVWITNFQNKTTEDLKAALDELDRPEAPLKGLVLDLRDNPGGLLSQAVSVADVFLENGIIVSIKGRDSRNTKNFKAHSNHAPQDYQIVVLINAGSASASEIVSGALQDQKRALLLGTPTFGKGSVQTVETLRDGYGLKFTIALYYTPSGRSIQAQGISPDIEVPHRFIDESEFDDETGLIKEKDLKNHLEIEPPEKSESEAEPDQTEDEEGSKDFRKNRHGPLELEKLMADNQIVRALEILISYDIFSGINGSAKAQ